MNHFAEENAVGDHVKTQGEEYCESQKGVSASGY